MPKTYIHVNMHKIRANKISDYIEQLQILKD